MAILTGHEIVNDEVGGGPLVVTYCPLCNSALVFERTVDGPDGVEVLDFGTSGRLYRYVLQGSDAAGNLYRSEVLTFETPAAAAIDRPGENVAPTGTVVEVSSEFSEGFAVENAIDGDPVTEWSSDGDGDDASITIELPEPTNVSGFALRSRSMGDGSSIIERYEVTVDDGEVLGPFDATVDDLTIAEVATTGRRFRFEAVTTTGGNTGAVEVEIITP